MKKGRREAIKVLERCEMIPSKWETYNYNERGFTAYNPRVGKRINLAWEAKSKYYRPKRNRKKIKGVVYFISDNNGHIKIGMTQDIKSRMNTLSTMVPTGVTLLKTIKSNDCRKLEAKLHEKYADKRVNGEWFKLDIDECEEINHD